MKKDKWKKFDVTIHSKGKKKKAKGKYKVEGKIATIIFPPISANESLTINPTIR
jgi:hypothetical protein